MTIRTRMKSKACGTLVLFFICIGVSTGRLNARVLEIEPVAQQTPEWCFAASAAMILQYLGYPDLNQFGNYQCAVVAAQGGPCMSNCGMCLGAGGTMPRVALILQSYAILVNRLTGYSNMEVILQESGILSPAQIIRQIDDDGPILAGISPGHIPYPPGTGFSQHAVVIIGYDGNDSDFGVVVNDPYPYPPVADPYVGMGSAKLRPGQYRIPYGVFVSAFHYGDSLTFR